MQIMNTWNIDWRAVSWLVITLLLSGHLALILIWWGNARQIFRWDEMTSKSLAALLLWFMCAGMALKNICALAEKMMSSASISPRTGKERDCNLHSLSNYMKLRSRTGRSSRTEPSQDSDSPKLWGIWTASTVCLLHGMSRYLGGRCWNYLFMA